MPPTIMSRGLIVPYTRTRRSIARLSASVPSRHTQFSVAFTANIAESNFRYTQAQSTQEAKAARQALAQRWILHSAESGAAQPCLVLRLRRGPDPRWPQTPADDPD